MTRRQFYVKKKKRFCGTYARNKENKKKEVRWRGSGKGVKSSSVKFHNRRKEKYDNIPKWWNNQKKTPKF